MEAQMLWRIKWISKDEMKVLSMSRTRPFWFDLERYTWRMCEVIQINIMHIGHSVLFGFKYRPAREPIIRQHVIPFFVKVRFRVINFGPIIVHLSQPIFDDVIRVQAEFGYQTWKFRIKSFFGNVWQFCAVPEVVQVNIYGKFVFVEPVDEWTLFEFVVLS